MEGKDRGGGGGGGARLHSENYAGGFVVTQDGAV